MGLCWIYTFNSLLVTVGTLCGRNSPKTTRQILFWFCRIDTHHIAPQFCSNKFWILQELWSFCTSTLFFFGSRGHIAMHRNLVYRVNISFSDCFRFIRIWDIKPLPMQLLHAHFQTVEQLYTSQILTLCISDVLCILEIFINGPDRVNYKVA